MAVKEGTKFNFNVLFDNYREEEQNRGWDRKYLNEVITFSIKNKNNLTLIEFKRELEPEDLPKIKPPDPVKSGFSSNVIILSGRRPIWLLQVFKPFLSSNKMELLCC